MARPVGHRHPARPAARRDGRDGHACATSRRSLSLLRRVYEVVVVDTPSALDDITLAFLDAVRHDPRDRHLRLDDDPQHAGGRGRVPRRSATRPTRCATWSTAPTPPAASTPEDLAGRSGRVPGAPGRAPTARSSSRPTTRASRSSSRTRTPRSARTSRGSPPSSSAAPAVRRRAPALSARVRPAPDRRLRLRGRRPDRPARDPAPAALRIHDLPRRQRPRAVRRPARRRGPPVLASRRSTRSSGETSRRSSSPATRPRPSPWRVPRAATTCRSWAWSGRAPRRPRWPRGTGGSGVIATPATVRSHAYFDAIKDENPAVEVYEHATPALVPLVEAGHPGRRRSSRRRSRTRWRRSSGERDEDGRVHLPAAAVGQDRHAAAGLHPLPAAAARPPGRGGRGRGDRGLRHGHRGGAGRAALRQRAGGARARRRGTAADAGAAGHSRTRRADARAAGPPCC